MSQATQIKATVQEIISAYGEKFSFSRAGQKLASVFGVYDKINGVNITAGTSSPTYSQQRSIIISVNNKYEPVILDVVQDSFKQTYQIVDVEIIRFEAVDVAYSMTIT